MSIPKPSALAAGAALLLLLIACGDSSRNICNCHPTEPASKDFRHDAKHVPLPNTTPTEITVATILSWPQPPPPAADAPRSGRELQLFHISHAFLHNARLMTNDCDIHFEISDSASQTAPRVIVETPSDSEYCSARQALQSALAQHRFQLVSGDASQTELSPALPVDVVGLAFQDFEHNRGTLQVATEWELHPAIVTVLP
jgi:hypothetical protein